MTVLYILIILMISFCTAVNSNTSLEVDEKVIKIPELQTFNFILEPDILNCKEFKMPHRMDRLIYATNLSQGEFVDIFIRPMKLNTSRTICSTFLGIDSFHIRDVTECIGPSINICSCHKDLWNDYRKLDLCVRNLGNDAHVEISVITSLWSGSLSYSLISVFLLIIINYF